MSVLFKLKDKSWPFSSNLLKDPWENDLSIILVHFLMKWTEFTNASYRLPAFLILTRINSLVHFLILSEIKSFSWVNFRTHSFLEILVRYFSISVVIELLKKVSELLICYLQAPVFEVEPKFIRCNISTFLFIQITKGFPYCFPLELYFFKYNFEQFLVFYVLSDYFCWLLHHFLFFLHVWVELGILDRVMSEIKTLWHVNSISKPFREISIVN